MAECTGPKQRTHTLIKSPTSTYRHSWPDHCLRPLYEYGYTQRVALMTSERTLEPVPNVADACVSFFVLFPSPAIFISILDCCDGQHKEQREHGHFL